MISALSVIKVKLYSKVRCFYYFSPGDRMIIGIREV
jgi:hypothetical protein